MSAPKATEAAVAAVQQALGCSKWTPRSKGVPLQCWKHLDEHAAAPWTERGCPVAVTAADAAAPHIAAQTQARVAELEHRLDRADHHLRLRTSALSRVLARERRERAMVVGTTAYFPGRIRQIVEEHHRRGW